MKYQVTIIVDTDTGEYSTQFRNLSHSGEPVDLHELMKCCGKILNDTVSQAEKDGHHTQSEH